MQDSHAPEDHDSISVPIQHSTDASNSVKSSAVLELPKVEQRQRDEYTWKLSQAKIGVCGGFIHGAFASCIMLSTMCTVTMELSATGPILHIAPLISFALHMLCYRLFPRLLVKRRKPINPLRALLLML